MKVAIIGAGIAGNVAAHRLHRVHDITVFEAAAHAGGHSDTHEVEVAGRRLAVDTGFIVYNERTYPRFIALLREHEHIESSFVMPVGSALSVHGGPGTLVVGIQEV